VEDKMRLIRRMLLATDFSERAQRAEQRAAMLCAALDCHLDLMTVRNPAAARALPAAGACYLTTAQTGLVRQAQRELEAVADRLQYRAPLRYDCSVRFGRPATEILAQMDELAVDLTTVATGSFAEVDGDPVIAELAGTATRPLLIVDGAPQAAYARVLAAIDFSEACFDAVRLALELAPDAQWLFLHALQLPQEANMQAAGATEDFIRRYRSGAIAIAERQMTEWIESCGLEAGRYEALVQAGVPAQVIGDHAGAMLPDLIAIGRRARSPLESAAPGQLMQALLAGGADILIAPEKKNREEGVTPLAA
jgi:nucleotide-binding universal stress UspA family protein